MAFADPQSVTINATPISLARTEFGASKGTFTSSDGTLALTISHVAGARGSARRLLRLQTRKIASDPLTSTNMEVTGSAHVVLDMPRAGFSMTDQKDLLKALSVLIADATVSTKFIGGEA